MSTACEAIRRNDDAVLKVTASGTVYAGQVLRLEDGRAAVKTGLETAASGDIISVDVEGVFDFLSASATIFSEGDEVVWNDSTNLAIQPSLAVDAAGVARAAKASGDLFVRVDLNKKVALRPVVFEFDTETDATEHVLIPASQNPNGLLILAIYGVVTEVFGGASEDQGIVTVKDGDGNSLATLTPTNAGADAIGDVIVGTGKVLGATTGDAIKTVAAGKTVTGIVSQATSGASAAGKMKVYVLATPLV
jgi:predicted RecA/RadA family phage recombinase